MKRLTTMLFVFALSAGSALAQKAQNPFNPCAKKTQDQTFVGFINDSACGLEHKMGMADAKACTIACIKMGSKYVLADTDKKVVYQLDDQKTPEQFAGQKVKVTGTLDKKSKTIKVKGIESA